jgi:subtilisin family serine protease
MKVNYKSTLIIALLAFSIFAVAIAPYESKISPALAEELPTVSNVDVLITTATSEYADLTTEISELGGEVTTTFNYVSGLSATIPGNAITTLMGHENVVKIQKDEIRTLATDIPYLPEDPEPGIASAYLESYETTYISADTIEGIELDNYWNNYLMGAQDVWGATGDFGQGSLVVIIDTGLYDSHFMFGGSSILGGIDMSPDVGDPTYEGWNLSSNHWHGTHVAGIVASTGGIVVPETDLLVQSIEYHTGMTLPDYAPGLKVIWLLGMAPAADLYAIKAFPHTGAGVPESRIIECMEYALSMHLSGDYDVDVISMSLGGPTRYDGRDLEDKVVDVITSHGITLVSSAGNDGPAQMTCGSPATAHTAISVAAAATPVQTKVYWDVAAYGILGIGDILFVSDTPQIFYYSSRGPTSDGRAKPTLAATGIMVMSAYNSPSSPQGIAWASGTSMACPAVSGTVALLNTYAEAFIPGATPEDYKQALVNGAVWLDGYNEYDQGAGFLNAYNALLELFFDPSIGDVAKPLSPTAGFWNPLVNIEMGNEVYETDIIDLAPGHKLDFNFMVNEHTDYVELEITDLDLGFNYGLNSFEVYIQSAKRSGYWYFIESANVWDDALFHIDDYETLVYGDVTGIFYDPGTRLAPIEPGIMKIVIENDWTSYDSISCHIKISRPTKQLVTPANPQEVIYKKHGFIRDGDWTGWIQVPVPENTVSAELTLSWMRDWRSYPTSDIDLIIYWDGGYNVDGATWNAPERAILENPTILAYYVEGYDIYSKSKKGGLMPPAEPYKLEIKFTLG